MNRLTNCKICKKELSGKQRLYCSVKCKNRKHQSYPAQKLRGLKRKLKLVLMAGGECSKCGYAKNLSGLSFHHLDAPEKDFKLDMRSLSNRTIEKVMNEFEKCILLCHNCHSEVHNPALDLEVLSSSRLL
ncbi:hypothetical protein KC725_05565 [Candidatus Peregrinibacteria bacterium]|nr:hypothetical protein [Candidatus Peregrinibacteria bacterium]